MTLEVVAGKHLQNRYRGRVRLRVPLFSNWAIEYLRQLQLGTNPQIDHRARLTVESISTPTVRAWRSSLFNRLRKRQTRIGLAIVLMGVCGLAAVNFSKQTAEKPLAQEATPKIVCSLGAEVSAARPKKQISFGGLESFVIDSSCHKAKYRVVRDTKTKELVRSIKLETN